MRRLRSILKISIILSIICVLTNSLLAQKKWSEDVAEIFFSKCTSCHNPNGIAPFPLTIYSTVVANKDSIRSQVLSGKMPPWPPDTSYTRLAHERILTAQEILDIVDWVDNGALEGDPLLAPPPPVYGTSGTITETPDLTLQMPNYKSKAIIEDDYICIVIPTNLASDKIIRAMEVIPGNIQIVHHVLVYIDDLGFAVTDTVGGDCTASIGGKLIGGYVPGSTPTMFPNGSQFKSGMTLPAGSDIILTIHYPEGSSGQLDSTKVNFFFHDDTVSNIREVESNSLIQNWFFSLPPNQTTNVSASYNVNSDFTLIGALPHMHLIGKSIKTYVVSPANDTIKLINIPNWDFEWQDSYAFQYLTKISSGSTLHGEGVYDNTSSNPNNPSSPPVFVNPGLNTTDEMFLIYYTYMDYQTGDEFINIDSLKEETTSSILGKGASSLKVSVHPNPFNKSVVIKYQLKKSSRAIIYIYDISGRVVRKLVNSVQTPGMQSVEWNGKNDLGITSPPGIYLYSMNIDGKNYNGKLVKSN